MNPTKIEWTDYSSNPIYATVDGKRGWFCEKVSPGCAHCYAAAMNTGRFGNGLDFIPANRERVEFHLNEKELLEWSRPKYAGKRVFAFDMTDLFGDWVSDEWLLEIWLAMALAPAVTFQILTKRPERARDFLHDLQYPLGDGRTDIRTFDGALWPLPNVWLGVTCENQHFADERIPILLDTPAAVRFVSCEPMLGPIDLTLPDCQHLGFTGDVCDGCGAVAVFERGPDGFDHIVIQETPLSRLSWVIAGGESGGPERRRLVLPNHQGGWYPKPTALAWARSLRDQCLTAGIPYFWKQWGGPTSKSGGRLLGGREWSEFPEVSV